MPRTAAIILHFLSLHIVAQGYHYLIMGKDALLLYYRRQLQNRGWSMLAECEPTLKA